MIRGQLVLIKKKTKTEKRSEKSEKGSDEEIETL